MLGGRGWLENRFQVIKSARNRPRQKELCAKEKLGSTSILSSPCLPTQTLASPSPPLGLRFFSYWVRGWWVR